MYFITTSLEIRKQFVLISQLHPTFDLRSDVFKGKIGKTIKYSIDSPQDLDDWNEAFRDSGLPKIKQGKKFYKARRPHYELRAENHWEFITRGIT